MEQKLNHFDEAGNAVMVDDYYGDKQLITRMYQTDCQ